jgi:hypothetical protein
MKSKTNTVDLEKLAIATGGTYVGASTANSGNMFDFATNAVLAELNKILATVDKCGFTKLSLDELDFDATGVDFILNLKKGKKTLEVHFDDGGKATVIVDSKLGGSFDWHFTPIKTFSGFKKVISAAAKRCSKLI